MARIHLRLDSADTLELRRFVLNHRRQTASTPLNITDGHGPTVTVEGPEKWGAQSSALTLRQAHTLLGEMIAAENDREGHPVYGRPAMVMTVPLADPELDALLDEEEAIERAAAERRRRMEDDN